VSQSVSAIAIGVARRLADVGAGSGAELVRIVFTHPWAGIEAVGAASSGGCAYRADRAGRSDSARQSYPKCYPPV